LHPDAAWREANVADLPFPIAKMFETADLEFAKELAAELEKPLKQADAKFLLTKLEGHRSIGFDIATQTATQRAAYCVPAPRESVWPVQPPICRLRLPADFATFTPPSPRAIPCTTSS